MLFLYRPRQTWMPYRLPRGRTDQAAYNRQLQARFQATQRVDPPASAIAPGSPQADAPRDPLDALKDLAQLHDSGALSDEEFALAKAKVLGTSGDPA